MLAFSTISAPAMITSTATGPFGAAGSALTFQGGSAYLGASGANAPKWLPAGNASWGLSAWVLCGASTSNSTGSSSSFMGALEWGAAGDTGGLATPSAAALVVGGVNGGIVSTLAGGGVVSYVGIGTMVSINSPRGVGVIPSNGYIVFSDTSSHLIRVVSPGGMVTLLAGGGSMQFSSGYSEGLGSSALFSSPAGLAVSTSGNQTTIFVADTGNHRIRQVTYPAGLVSTFAGGNPSYPSGGWVDGTGTSAAFFSPQGIAVVPSGQRSGYLVVADTSNARIRLISPSGVVSTLAGGGTPSLCCADGLGSFASFLMPQNVAVIPSSGSVVVTDSQNQHVRLVSPAGLVTTLAGSSNPLNLMIMAGSMAGSYVDATGTTAGFNFPQGVAVMPTTEYIVLADSNNYREFINELLPNECALTVKFPASRAPLERHSPHIAQGRCHNPCRGPHQRIC